MTTEIASGESSSAAGNGNSDGGGDSPVPASTTSTSVSPSTAAATTAAAMAVAAANFRKLAEMWHPHVYAVPPKSPTPFSIDDILSRKSNSPRTVNPFLLAAAAAMSTAAAAAAVSSGASSTGGESSPSRRSPVVSAASAADDEDDDQPLNLSTTKRSDDKGKWPPTVLYRPRTCWRSSRHIQPRSMHPILVRVCVYGHFISDPGGAVRMKQRERHLA